MCGRCFCTSEPEILSKSCSYKDASGKFNQVPWIYPNNTNNYKPSTNIGPKDYLPIIASGKHFGNKENRVLIPMLWGMVPNNWMHDPKKHKAITHNARIETIQETMYKVPLAQGYRCVAVVEGFYEWKTTGNDKTKQPYFIYLKQKDGIKIENPSSWANEWNEEEGWQGLNVLKMAGLFRRAKNAETGDITYSFTVITQETNNVLSWLHHRMPVLLLNSEDEEIWLNYDKFTKDEALTRIIKMSLPNNVITWHPISTSVNDVRNKQSDLIMPVKSKEKENQKAKQLMTSWLKGNTTKGDTKRKSDSTDDDKSKPDKKSKTC